MARRRQKSAYGVRTTDHAVWNAGGTRGKPDGAPVAKMHKGGAGADANAGGTPCVDGGSARIRGKLVHATE